jgi:hypothetical protein
MACREPCGTTIVVTTDPTPRVLAAATLEYTFAVNKYVAGAVNEYAASRNIAAF